MNKSHAIIESMVSSPEKWMAYIQLRCRECEGCGARWAWAPKTNKHRVPIMKVKDTTVNVRRALYRLSKGVFPHAARGVSTNCTNNLCVNPALLVQLSKLQLVERAAKAGKFSGVTTGLKIAAAKRKTSKLSQEAVRDIMTRTEKASVYATLYGISESYVHMLWNGQFRQEHGTPFAGLFTGLAANDSKRRAA